MSDIILIFIWAYIGGVVSGIAFLVICLRNEERNSRLNWFGIPPILKNP